MAFWPRKSSTPAPSDVAGPQPSAATLSSPPPSQPSATSAAAAVTTASTPLVEAPQLSPEQLKKMAETSKRLSAAFGEIVSIFMRTPGYNKMPLADLEWLVVPAVAAGQFTVAEGQSKTNGFVHPVGAVLWARVSDELDGRMSADPNQSVRLKPEEWTSGEKIWVMEAIGEPRIVDAILKRMSESAWSGRTVKFKTRNKEGKTVIALLQPGAPPQV